MKLYRRDGRARLRLPLVALMLALVITPRGRAQSPAPAVDPIFRSGTASVLVDVVVKDRHGAPVVDLTPLDFEVLENGVKQPLEKFEFIKSSGGGGPLSVVALTFDPLSPEAQRLASTSVVTYVQKGETLDYTGVFRVGARLEPLQWFTRDAEAVLRAVAGIDGREGSRGAAAGGPRSGPASRATSTPRLTGENTVTITIFDCATGEILGYSTSSTMQIGGDMVEATSDKSLKARVERSIQELEQQDASEPLNGLLALVDGMSAVQGRKTIVYFSEGLRATPRALRQREALIDAANRHNIAIYAVDAAGLRGQSGREEVAANLQEQSQFISGLRERSAEQGWTRDLEGNEELLQSNATKSLDALARHTGGFVIAETNDLARGLQAIEADRRSYYLVRYTPTNIEFDGKFRRIGVRVNRSGVTVRARSGYKAVRAPAGIGALVGDEAAAVAALEATPRPTAVPVRGLAASVPWRDSPGRAVLMLRADASALTFTRDGGRFRADATLMGLLRSASGEVVHKISQRFDLNGPLADLDAVKQKTLVLDRHVKIPEGTYTLEFVAYDALSRKAGASQSSVVIPPSTPAGVATGTLLIVRGTRPAERGKAETDPLEWNGLHLEPGLGEPMSKGAAPTVSFFLPLVVAEGHKPAASLTLLRGTQPLGSTPLDVPPPDAAGRSVITGQLPTANFPPGDYTLRITVAAGGAGDVREAGFTLAP